MPIRDPNIVFPSFLPSQFKMLFKTEKKACLIDHNWCAKNSLLVHYDLFYNLCALVGQANNTSWNEAFLIILLTLVTLAETSQNKNTDTIYKSHCRAFHLQPLIKTC